jgi:hypothetical protein
MHLIYIDDSRDEKLCVFSALAADVTQWRNVFECVRRFRRGLRKRYGIYVYKEFHAWKFVSGRGNISDRVVTKRRRCEIFAETLTMMAQLPGVRMFNACFPRKADLRALERLTNRIDRTLRAWESHGLLISDQGKELDYTRLVRRMTVFNPIPSQYGGWAGTGQLTRNIPIRRIVEDMFFKDSSQSYFIQLVDFAAYALLRRERPVPSKTRYGLHTAFDVLDPILVKEATQYDPQGIIRP